MKFVNPQTDYAFKKIFGSKDSHDILKSFLNAVIYQGNPTITDISIPNPHSLAQINTLKDTILDVTAVINHKKTVIIEMQVLRVKAFDKRVIYNMSKTYGTQLEIGKSYWELKPVITVTITNFIMFPDNQRIVNNFFLSEKHTREPYPDYPVELFFVELPKFKKGLTELETLLEQWIYFLKNTSELQEIPNEIGSVPEINKALGIANESSLTRDELELLTKQVLKQQDEIGAIEIAKELAEAKGRIEGKAEEKINTNLRLLDRKIGQLNPEIRQQIEQLSYEQLEQLFEATFDFTTIDDLTNWLNSQNTVQ